MEKSASEVTNKKLEIRGFLQLDAILRKRY